MKGNVLVVGNSGVGKSTLINAVLGETVAKTGWGTEGTTSRLDIYENEKIPFRIIDTVGFEPSFIKKHSAINAIKKWSKGSAKDGKEENRINVIWFCIDGTSRKLFAETIKSLSSATKIWESVPIIVTITKSYSVPEREENIQMVNNAFAKQKHYSKNLRKVIPVVASTYVINDTSYVAADGISELIDETNSLMPEGIRAAENDINSFKLNRKRVFAQSIVSTATTSAAVVGAIPVPFADATILTALEFAEISALAKVYGIKNNEESKLLLNSIVEVGTVSAVAKGAISALKAIPGINIAAGILNATIAACFAAAIGEASSYVFEQIYLGKKNVTDIDWVKKILESELSSGFVNKVQGVFEKIKDNMEIKDIVKLISDIFKKS